MKETKISIASNEMDFISQYLEIRKHEDIFSLAIKLLHDLCKLDEGKWRLALQKSEVDEETEKVIYDENYNNVVFLMKWLAPSGDSFIRLPTPEKLDKVGLKNNETF